MEIQEKIKRINEILDRIKGIDDEKYKIFLERLIDAVREAQNDNGNSIDEVIFDILYYYESRTLNQLVVTPTRKPSVFDRIISKIKKPSNESEIARLAKALPSKIKAQSDSLSASDERTPIYDFFDRISRSYLLADFFNTEPRYYKFVDGDGYGDVFSVFLQKDDLHGSLSNGKDFEVPFSGMEEDNFLSMLLLAELLESQNVINSIGTELKDSIKESNNNIFKASEIFFKKIMKNSTCKEAYKSYERAHEEYLRTSARFREEERRKELDKKYPSAIDLLKVKVPNINEEGSFATGERYVKNGEDTEITHEEQD